MHTAPHQDRSAQTSRRSNAHGWVELQARYDREHRLVGMLQRALLLSAPHPCFPDLHVEGTSETAFSEALLGGDFFDVVPLDGENVALVLGDVCGKGLLAALHVPGTKFALRAFLSESPSPSHALACLNDQLCAARGSGRELPSALATTSLVVLNRTTGAAACCIAGADPPLILREGGPCGVVPVTGMMLGVKPGGVYLESRFCLNPGDVLLQVTDGITEARRGNKFLGYDGVVELVTQAWVAGTPGEARSRALAPALFLGARRFADGPLHDDASVLVVERRAG